MPSLHTEKVLRKQNSLLTDTIPAGLGSPELLRPAPEDEVNSVPIQNVLSGKRVAMVTFSPYPADPRPRRAIAALIAEGMLVDLLCMTDGKSPQQETCGNLDIRRLPIKNLRGGKLAYMYQYSAFILLTSVILAIRTLRKRYDLVYVHNMPDILVVCALVPKLFGAKIVLDMHDPMPELMRTIFGLDENSLGVRLIKALEKWSFARTDQVITVNLACKRIFSLRSCAAGKIEVVMNSPDESLFPFRPAVTYVSDLASSPKKLVIMYHGSLLARNGLDLAVDALAMARENVPNVELRIYGAANPFFGRVIGAAQQKGLDSCIRYCGLKSLEGIAQAIAECDVGIVPNHRNTFTEINTPTRIFEYLALGKPVIAPSTPGILDYFQNDELLAFEPGNSADLARQIEYVAANYQAAAKAAKRGQQVYLEHTWQQERTRLIQAIRELFGPQEV